MPEDINFDGLTNNAEGWARYFEEHKEAERDQKARVALAFGRIRSEIYAIIKDELEEAINNSNEYGREKLATPLREAFSHEDLVHVTDDGEIYFTAEYIAGDWQDLQDGIEGARELLKEENENSGRGSHAQRAKYWANIVWPAEEGLWKETIDMRYQFWSGLAPFWLYLENGTGGAGTGAYPWGRASNFLYKSKLKAQKMMTTELREVESLEQEVIDGAMNKYANDVENYKPYDILEEFYKDGRKYYVYVTSTRRIGVALEKTYKGLSR